MSKYTKEERWKMDAKIPKCKCGNNLSRDRQEEGIKNCPACDPIPDDRKTILLKAVLEILEKQEESHYILNFFEQTAFYDSVDCDGYYLFEDIKTELDID